MRQRKSNLEIFEISYLLTNSFDGIKKDIELLDEISNSPTHYLCNEAYWYLLQKFKGNVILIHIPSIKNMNGTFIEKMKQVFPEEEKM